MNTPGDFLIFLAAALALIALAMTAGLVIADTLESLFSQL